MSTWQQLKDHLVARGIPYDELTQTQLRIRFEYDDKRSQTVVATQQQLRGEPWCELTSVLGAASASTMQDLLSRPLVGGIFVSSGGCLLRSVHALQFLSGEAFEFYARGLAGQADALEAELFKADKF